MDYGTKSQTFTRHPQESNMFVPKAYSTNWGKQVYRTGTISKITTKIETKWKEQYKEKEKEKKF